MGTLQQSGGKDVSPQQKGMQATQSENSLSRTAAEENEDGRFSVAEEVNLDQQSDAAHHIGHMPEDVHAQDFGGASESDASDESASGNADDERRLKKSMDRAVPPSA